MLAGALRKAGFEVRLYPQVEMTGVMYGKLLLNLINAICALAGVPIRRTLLQSDYRLVWSKCLNEALEVSFNLLLKFLAYL